MVDCLRPFSWLLQTKEERKREREKDEELSNKKNKKRNVRKKSRWGMIRGGGGWQIRIWERKGKRQG